MRLRLRLRLYYNYIITRHQPSRPECIFSAKNTEKIHSGLDGGRLEIMYPSNPSVHLLSVSFNAIGHSLEQELFGSLGVFGQIHIRGIPEYIHEILKG